MMEGEIKEGQKVEVWNDRRVESLRSEMIER